MKQRILVLAAPFTAAAVFFAAAHASSVVTFGPALVSVALGLALLAIFGLTRFIAWAARRY